MLRGIRWGSAAHFGALAILTVACTTSAPTKMTDVWKDPSYTAGPMKNIVVFGGKMNETNRRSLEDAFVSELSTHSVHATASYRLFPGELPGKEQARSTLEQAGVDGVLVSTMMGINEKPTFVSAVPGAAPPGWGGAPGFWEGYYGPGWGSPYVAGYVVNEPVVKFQTSLWDPKGEGRVVWSADTRTDNPSSSNDFMTSLLKEVIPAMTKAGFLPPKGEGNAVSYAHAPILP